jgi:hypothetical protein
MMSSAARLLDLRSALSTRNNRAAEEPKPECSEAKTGCLGSCTRSTQETHYLTCQAHTRDSVNGWRDADSLSRARAKPSARTDSRNSRRTWSGVRTTVYWLQMLKHLPQQIRGPVLNKKEREQVLRYLRSKRSLEIQRYLNAVRDWIGEREMWTENRRFQRFASIALSCHTTSHLR